MRHPSEFYIRFDIAMDWQKRQKEVLASGKMPKFDLMYSLPSVTSFLPDASMRCLS